MTTYGEVTRRIKFELSADRSFTDAILKDAVYDAIREVARICAPLILISKDMEDAIFRGIDDVNFLRVPINPSGLDTEKIDIDDLLVDAVIYMACKRLSRDRKADYDMLAKKVINDFNWAMHETLEGNCDVL